MALVGDTLTGTCAFRLMPTDELVGAPSSVVVTDVGTGLTVHYTWRHPTDGEQRGALLVGAADQDGAVEAAWCDTWHQQPGLMRLAGSRSGSRLDLGGTYAEEWGWTIALDLPEERVALTMTMCNVVPGSAVAALPADGPPPTAGPYAVMVASWGTEPGPGGEPLPQKS